MVNNRKSLIKLIISMLIWGSIGVFRKSIPMSSASLACLRGLSGALFVLIFALLTKQKLRSGLSLKKMLFLILSGVLVGANWMFLFEAFDRTSVATATLLYYIEPTIVILLSPLFFREKLTVKKTVCALISLVGMMLVSGILTKGESGGDFSGIIFGIGSAVLYSTVVIMNKKLTEIEPYEKTVVQLASAGITLVPYVLLTEGIPQVAFEPFNIIMLAVICLVHTGVAYVLYFGSFEGLKSQTVAILSYIDPVSALLFSWLLLREKMSVYELIGAVLIIGAACICEITIKKQTNIKAQ